jgi:hypothetical protein
MAIFKIAKNDTVNKRYKGKLVSVLKKDKFDKFNESILGLGDIHKKPRKIDALSAIFDLEGFTNFCNQRDPDLYVSNFLSKFLNWIFNEIKTVQIQDRIENSYLLYGNLPFLSKFLGDGILFLWNTSKMDERQINNSIIALDIICKNYKEIFYPNISKKMLEVPPRLRCGIAKGTVFSVGNGNDFVGSCINVSSRLQKLNNLSFCFSTVGIDISKMDDPSGFYVQKKVNIRGIGEELIGIKQIEYASLPKEEKKNFTNV